MIRVQSVEGATPSKPTNISLASIRLDGGTQARAKLNDETIAEYSEALAAGATFPPITVFYDGTDYWLGDGFHRHAAHLAAGKKKIIADVRPGTSRDAILHSVGANETHGLRRTRNDKRLAVLTLLNDPEWSKQGIRWIARTAAVSEGLAHKLFHERTGVHNEHLEEAGGDLTCDRSQHVEVTRGDQTYMMDTSGMRKTGADEPKAITPETIAPQGVEGGEELEKPNEEIATAEPHSADPFGESEMQGRPFPDPLEDQSSADEDPFVASSENKADAGEPASAPATPMIDERGQQYLRGLVHVKIRGFDTFCKEHTPEYVARGVRSDEVASMRHLVGRVNKWLEAFLAAAKAGGNA